MRCGTARVFIQETLDAPLSPPDEAMLEAHLAGCDPCRGYKASMGRIAGGLGSLSSHGAPRDFAASVSFQLGRERSRRRWAPIAAAAAVLVGFVVARPYLMGGEAVQFATADLGKAASGAKMAAQAPGIASRLAEGQAGAAQSPGGSLLDGMAAQSGDEPAEQPGILAAAKPQGQLSALNGGDPRSGLQGAETQSRPQIALRAAVSGGLPAISGGVPAISGGEPAISGGVPAISGGVPAVSGGVPADRRVTGLLPAGSARDERPRQVAAAPRPEPAAMSNAGPALDVTLEAKTDRLLAIREAEAQKAEVAEERTKEAAAPPSGTAIAAYRTAESTGVRAQERPASRAAARSAESRRNRASAAPRKAMTSHEQHQVDMATFEALRWLDPSAEGGADLELREVDFTVP